MALSGDARGEPGVAQCEPSRSQEPVMGYGNPLFDGDEPLPPRKRAHPNRLLSMRLWLGAVLAGTLGEGSGLPDRHEDEDRGRRGAESQWRETQGDWNERR